MTNINLMWKSTAFETENLESGSHHFILKNLGQFIESESQLPAEGRGLALSIFWECLSGVRSIRILGKVAVLVSGNTMISPYSIRAG